MVGIPASSGDGHLASFVVPATAGEGIELPIRAATARIGQGPQNDLVLDDDSVSTTHAQLEFRSGNWRLTDLGSRNGTYINGTRLVPDSAADVPDGATVAFGALKLHFRHGAGVVPAAMTDSETKDRSPQQRSRGFRLPVWLLLLIILLIAAIVFLVITLTGGPAIPEPAAGAPAAHIAGHDPGPA